jgi:hypothetical protein
MASSNPTGPVSRADTERLISAVRELRAHAEMVTEQVQHTVAQLHETRQQTRTLVRQASEARTARANGWPVHQGQRR